MRTHKRDFITILDYTSKELEDILLLSARMKADRSLYSDSLKKKTLGLIFDKHSTRTRISFEVGMSQLGGVSFYYGPGQLQLERGELIKDTSLVLSRYLDGVVIRTFSHVKVLEFAKYASIPIINGLTDFNHPCQVMADLLTIREKFGTYKGLKLAYLGDGNNVATSLLIICVKMGIDISIITPKEYSLSENILNQVQDEAREKDVEVMITDQISEGVSGAKIIYTDKWASMGQEDESERKKEACKKYSVDDSIMKLADQKAIFMHCLPAQRQEEVAASVIDGPQSVVFDQAENRLHTQKAILWTLLG